LLIQRVASAAVGVPVIIALIWLGGVWFTAAVAVAMAVASLEFTHLRRGWFEPVCILTALVTAGVIVGAHGDELQWGLWLAGATGDAAVAAANNPTDDGRSWAYLALLATFAVDTAAYFTGRAIGTHKLAPKISPKKTVEGFVGGWFAGALAVIALHYAFDLGFALQHVVALGVALPLAATVGDLLESAIKRMEQVKDASELIPGHGGVLDRFDSLLFTFPLVYLFVQWFG
jgi:CDP-diglyceride synthetase